MSSAVRDVPGCRPALCWIAVAATGCSPGHRADVAGYGRAAGGIRQRVLSTNLRNGAEARAVGLEIGATGVADVVAWADGIIAAAERPHWSVCELATMGRSYELDVIQALGEVLVELDEAWVRQEVVRQLARGLAEDRLRADKIASALYNLAYNLAMADGLPDEELLSIARWAWDALSLAGEGMVEDTREQVIDTMLDAPRVATASAGGAT